jgi:hypothetical protein
MFRIQQKDTDPQYKPIFCIDTDPKCETES